MNILPKGEAEEKEKPGPIQLFLLFLKIGVFTIGGGLAMLPLVQLELVEKKKWLPLPAFINCLTVAQSVPGPIVINLSLVTGYRLKGLKGGLSSMLGAVLPSFFLMLAVAAFFWQYRENPLALAAFQGIRPAVAALIAASAVKLGLAAFKHCRALLLCILFMTALIAFNIHPLYIIAGGIGLGFFLPRCGGEQREL